MSKIANLLELYELGTIKSIMRDKIGTGENYIVCTDEGKFFLKFFERDDRYSHPETEILVSEALSRDGLPVATFAANRQGEKISYIDDAPAHIQHYIEGQTYNNNDMPERLLINSSALLGKIHLTLSPHTGEEASSFLSGITDLQKQERHFLELLAMAESMDITSDLKKRITSDLRFRLEVFDKFAKFDLAERYSKLTYGLSHGDYNVRQLITSSSSIKAVIDFSRASKLPLAWEIARSYTLGARECKNCNIDAYRFDNYLGSYLKEFPLVEEDVFYMLELYLLQLSTSSFGYRNYIYEQNSALLPFAFWRTDMARSLSQLPKVQNCGIMPKRTEDINIWRFSI